jgi:putative transposase
MEKMKDEHPVAAMAEALEVSRSGFFAHRHKEAPRRQQDGELARAIKPIFAASRQTYGCPRVAAALRQGGYRCGKNRVARLMRFELPAPQAEAAALAAHYDRERSSPAGG